jgi:hypothetical protein
VILEIQHKQPPCTRKGEQMALAIIVTLEKELPGPHATAAYAKGKTGKAMVTGPHFEGHCEL